MRVAFVLRSAEVQPLFRDLCGEDFHPLDTSLPPRHKQQQTNTNTRNKHIHLIVFPPSKACAKTTALFVEKTRKPPHGRHMHCPSPIKIRVPYFVKNGGTLLCGTTYTLRSDSDSDSASYSESDPSKRQPGSTPKTRSHGSKEQRGKYNLVYTIGNSDKR